MKIEISQNFSTIYIYKDIQLVSILDFIFDIIGSLFKPLVICLVIFLIIAWLIWEME